MPRLIKRYRNRKLYDTERSCYVTLDEIATMVKAGEEIQIIEKRSGEDLTNVTLAQIILEEQKRTSDEVSRGALQNIIQSGGQLIQKLSSPVAKVGDDIRRRAESLEEGRHALLRDIDARIKDAVGQMTHVPRLQRDLRRATLRIDELELETRKLRQIVEELSDRTRSHRGAVSLPSQKSNPTLAV